MQQLAFQSASDLSMAIRRGEVSSQELLELYLERFNRFNPALNAIVVVRREEALKEARNADRALATGAEVGPFHGVPMTIKESFDVDGLPTTWGSESLRNNHAAGNALAVQRMRKAGVVLYGKTNVPYMLADIQTYNHVYGTTNNPFNTALTPGGSSGGSAAALAAGLTAVDAGSDIGGSIRNPAHYCGIFGHKPTWNLLPPRGHATPGILSPSDISVIGPLARSAKDLEIALRAMAGPDEIQSRGLKLDLPSLNEKPSQLRVALWRDDPEAPVNHEVSERVDRVGLALRDAGAQVHPEARPGFSSAQAHFVYRCLLNATMTARQSDERYQAIEEFVKSIPAEDTSADSLIRRSQTASFREWVRHNEERTQIRWAWHRFFQDYDFVIAPVMATAAFPHDHGPMGQRYITVNGESQEIYRQIFWAGLSSSAYLPSTAIPTGLDLDGLPIGVQIIGPEFGDLRTIGLAQILESEGFRFVPPPDFS